MTAKELKEKMILPEKYNGVLVGEIICKKGVPWCDIFHRLDDDEQVPDGEEDFPICFLVFSNQYEEINPYKKFKGYDIGFKQGMKYENWPQSDDKVIALLQSISIGNISHCWAMTALYYFYRTIYGYNEQESLAQVYMVEGKPINNPAEFVFPSFQTDVEAKEFICEIGLGKGTKPTIENKTWTIAALSLYAMKRKRCLSIQESLEEIFKNQSGGYQGIF